MHGTPHGMAVPGHHGGPSTPAGYEVDLPEQRHHSSKARMLWHVIQLQWPRSLRQRLKWLLAIAIILLVALSVYLQCVWTTQYYHNLFEEHLANPFWHRYWDHRVTEARLLLTPLNGAWFWWTVCPPFYPFGCMMAHPHIVVAIADSGIYRTYEYHPDWPPMLKFMHGWGHFKRTDSPQWTPTYRLGWASRWVQLPVRDNVTVADIETWNRQFCCLYSIFQSNCQHYTIDLMEFLSGQRLNIWTYDTIPLPNYLFILFIILQGLAIPVIRQAMLLIYYIAVVTGQLSPFLTRADYITYLKLDVILAMVSTGCITWFVTLCQFEFERQAPMLGQMLNGGDSW